MAFDQRKGSVLVMVAMLAAARLVYGQTGVPDPSVSSAKASPFRGLAQAPEANLFAGSATTSIPIEVPPGRKGLMPQLRLVYNSASGPSPYGHGWQLPLGAITRSRKHGVLSCNDALARRQMVVSLPQGEIECTLAASAVDGWQRCTAAIEEAFLRIDYHPQSNRWLVRDKGGLVYGFGEADHARSGAVTATGWVDGDPCRYTHSWSLTSILDPHGNRVDLQYERVGGVSYAATILYGGNPEQGLAHAFQVRFVWGGRAPLDQPLNSSGGFPARLTRLLRSIEVSYPIDAAPVRSYRFGYDFDSAATQRPGRSSFLTAVTLYGRNGLALARADGLPASTTFRYHEVRSEDRKLEGASLSWPSGVRALRYEKGKEHRDLHIDLRDMNGDGILDLVDTTRCSANNRRWDVYLGSAAGYGGEALPWHTIDTSWACHLSNVDVDGNDADTDHDAIDLNGDGLPDLVDARQQPWQVYFGRPPGAGHGWGFDPSAASWAATVTTWFEQPVYALRATDGGDGWVDVVDWNGDGLPDLLNARSGRVHHNTGSGFDPLGTAVSFPNHRLRYGSEHHVREGLFDLNGDSLPDLVRAADDASTWQVYFHQGAQLATTAETWQAPIDCADGITSIEGGDTTNRDLFDINGDGLLDLVESCHWSTQSPYWQVRLNHGSGFAAQAIAWRSPLRWIRYENDCLEPGERCVFYQMIDGDGDALADLVDGGDRWLKPSSYWIHRNGAGAWRQGCDGACVNPDGGRAELLVQIQNGIGGITDLRYRPSTDWDNSDVDGVPQLPMVLWNVVEITQRSDMAEVVPGASTLSTTMRYAYGKFDAAMREFRGFGTVYTADGGGTQTATVFKQDAARKGKIEQVRIYAAGADPESDIPLEASLNQWSCADPITGVRLSCAESLLPGERRWPRLEASHRYTYNANGIDDLLYKHSVAENLAWDAYGNITRVRQSGDNATPAIETATEYAAVDTAAAYLVDRPAHVSIASGDTVSEKWFMYDGLPLAQVSRGNLTREEIWLDHPSPGASGCAAASGQMCAASVFEHDGLGNVVQVRDALGRTTRIEHDSLGLYPIRATNPLGHVVRSEYDPACGKQTMQTLPNATAHHRRVYDEHCRLSQTYLPGQTTPERRIHYYLGGRGVATDIFTETAETASPTGWNEADELFDSLGRPVQRLRSATVDGYRTLVADNTVAYDERGEVVRVHSAFTTSYAFGPGGIVLYRAAPAGADTTLERDALGRVTRIRHPDGSERRTDHTTAWQTATTDECYHSGTCPGGRTVEVVDAAGRVIEKRSYERSGASETLKAGMKYAYDGAGRVINTTQWDGARWAPATRITLRYDSMGRKIEKQDPDSGTWRYGYDLAGNLLFEDDPQTDQHVQFCYDAGDRVVSKYVFRDRDWQDVGSACGSAEVAETTYTYDGSGPNEIGRLIRVDDGSGTTFLERYDEQGRARSVTRELIVANHRERATMTYDYDRAGHLRAIGYPDGEMALYEYDESGQVQAVRSSDSTVYLANQTYDIYGRPRQTTHGNGPGGVGVTATREYSGAERRHRLNRLYVAPAPGGASLPACAAGALLVDLSYAEYHANGLLRRIGDANSGCVALSSAGSFSYDGLGRLTEVSGNAALAGTFAYDLLGNLTRKDGRRLAYSTSRPHTLSSIDGAAVSHDRNGNRVAKPGASYRFAPEDRLESINDGAVAFAYDYSGRLVLRHTPAGTTRYFDQLAEYRVQAASGILTKHYFAGNQRIASRESRWTPQIELASANPWLTIAGLSGPAPRLLVLVRDGWSKRIGLAAGAAFFAVLLLPQRRRRRRCAGIRLRRRDVTAVLLLFLWSSLPLPVELRPLSQRPAYAGGQGPVGPPPASPAPPALRLLHYHPDHLGSTQLITDGQGQVVQHIRYRPYGEVRGRWDSQLRSASDSHRFEFAGYENDAGSGLQNAGARFYDPALGSFLTHDPARQFPSPYSYGGGDPLNWSDPDGREFLSAIVAVAVAAVAAAAINSVVAAAQGAPLSQIGRAAAVGAITAAASVGLGIVFAGVNIGVSAAAGTLPATFGGVQGAAQALAEVATRSAAASVASNLVGQAASALGAPRGAVIASTVIAGYLAAHGYDSMFLDSHGKLASLDGKGIFRSASSTPRHQGQTAGAASHVFSDPGDIALLARENHLQDGHGVLNARMLNNQTHFGSLARQTAAELKRVAVLLRDSGAPRAEYIATLGRASHYVQDQFALGHIFPGTHLLGGPWGAVPRFLIHQTFGGEATFVQGQFNATLDLFRQVGTGSST